MVPPSKLPPAQVPPAQVPSRQLAPLPAPVGEIDAVLQAILRDAAQVALDLADRVQVERKGDGSPVTAADRAAERIINHGLRRAFPDDSIIGEEGSRHQGSSDRTWVVDPIDGTDAFTHGLAYWGPTVACLVDGHPVLGALLLPVTGDYWFADLLTTAPAAWHNGRSLSPQDSLSPGSLSLGSLSDEAPHRNATLFVPSRLHHVATVSWPGKFRSLGSTAAHLALVASGSGHAALVGPSPAWDTAAGVALIQASGGVVSPLAGGGLVAGRRAAVQHLLRAGTIQLSAAAFSQLH